MSWGDLNLYTLLPFRVSLACEVRKIVPWACYWNSLSHAAIFRIHLEVPMTRPLSRRLGAVSVLPPIVLPCAPSILFTGVLVRFIMLSAKHYIDY